MRCIFRAICRWLRLLGRRLSLHRPKPTWKGRRKVQGASPVQSDIRNRRKPDWVPGAVAQLKAMQPELSCRDIATFFNRVHASRSRMTIGKTYVAGIIRTRQHEIAMSRRRVRERKGTPGHINRTWGIDLTGKMDISGHIHSIFGVIDHGSRANLLLKALKDRSSVALLRLLLDVIEQHGKPDIIRTDNESIFTSRLFRFGLRLLDVRHQTTDLHCPWQNGRIERFFGTLKRKLDQWIVPDLDRLDHSLAEFRFWYNAVRPHQSLGGRTPSEVWNDIDVHKRRSRKIHAFSAWDGLLTGLYLPP